MNTPTVASQHALDKALDHVLYEMEMLLDTAYLLPENPPISKLHNAILESFIVHARCLDEFFRLQGPQNDPARANMNAWFFVPTWIAARPHPLLNKMNREISHLGWDRKEPGTPGIPWKILEVTEPIKTSSLTFLLQVRPRPDLMSFRRNLERTEVLVKRFNALPPLKTIAVPVASAAVSSSYVTTSTVVTGGLTLKKLTS